MFAPSCYGMFSQVIPDSRQAISLVCHITGWFSVDMGSFRMSLSLIMSLRSLTSILSSAPIHGCWDGQNGTTNHSLALSAHSFCRHPVIGENGGRYRQVQTVPHLSRTHHRNLLLDPASKSRTLASVCLTGSQINQCMDCPKY